ncbi:MAG: hypothetical protein LCI03_08975 [Actinobacteria bacterium]|nr:hypothetical protein [Actinomycetota bacterium]
MSDDFAERSVAMRPCLSSTMVAGIADIGSDEPNAGTTLLSPSYSYG